MIESDVEERRIERSLRSKKIRKNGDIRDVVVVALPMLLSMSFDTLMTFVDRLFLSKLGPAEMNASLGAGGMQLMMMTFFTGVLSYSTAMVAQRFGAGKKHECAGVFMQAVYLAIACFPLLCLTIPLGHFIFDLQGLDRDQLGFQKTYFDILMLGGIVNLVRNVAPCFFSGIGKTKVVMKAAFCGMIVNIVCNYFLIFGNGPFPQLGVAGAAYGTLIGNVFSAAYLYIAYFSKRYRESYGTARNLNFNMAYTKELLRRGLPSGAEMFLNMTAFQSMILLFHGLGSVEATAASVMFNWDMVAYVPLMGLEVASTSLVGRYVGAKNAAAATRSTYSGLKVGWAYSLVIGILLIFLPGVLTDIFRPEASASAEAVAMFDAARPLSIFMLRFATLYIFVEVFMVIYCGALRGAGDTVWVMIACALMNWFNTVALYVAAYVLHVPGHCAWIIVVVVYSTAPLIFFYRWKSGKWRRHVLDKPKSC
ncbi:MAG: MATE family efflux transporter [Fibrobacter sp.]|nr:MATE family efflux transporter [Fibrobacter sp.]